MKRQIFVLLIGIFVSQLCEGQATCILFEKNSASVDVRSRSRLDSLVLEIKRGGSGEQLGISGHTDIDASESYNKGLSYKRALAVRDYLIGRGVKNQIHLDSKGESEQLNGNETESDKAKNRRVEIVLNYSKNNFAFDSFGKEFQTYTINNNRDTLLKCKDGSAIEISKGAFNTGDVSTPVTIKVQEYYSKKDFVLANLTTQDLNNDMLESRGMINVEAYQGDIKVELKPGQDIGILFKDRKPGDRTETFNGITHGDGIVWAGNSGSSKSKIHGGGMTKISGAVIEENEWEYIEVVGESYKVTRTTRNGKTTYDTVSAASEMMTNELVLKSNKLGWINCDRFNRDSTPKIDVIVEYSGAFVPSVVVVFQDINSVLPFMFREDNKLIFKNIPSGKEIVFVGLYRSKSSGKILFAQKKSRSRTGFVEKITFDELNAEEVEQRVNSL